MADVSSNWENLAMYYANLSPVYLCSSLFTLIALLFTWWFCHKDCSVHSAELHYKDNQLQSSGNNTKHTSGSSLENSWDRDETQTEADQIAQLISDNTTMKHIKSARQLVLEKKLRAGLSEEQLLKEKETQASQLAAIYKLLQEQEDQFQIKSMDELQEQLKLYRPL